MDYGADLLEQLSKEVAAISRRSFKQYAKAPSKGPKSSKTLRATLLAISAKAGEHLSEVRDTLLGLQHIATFVSEAAHGWLSQDAYTRLQTIVRDLR